MLMSMYRWTPEIIANLTPQQQFDALNLTTEQHKTLTIGSLAEVLAYQQQCQTKQQ